MSNTKRANGVFTTEQEHVCDAALPADSGKITAEQSSTQQQYVEGSRLTNLWRSGTNYAIISYMTEQRCSNSCADAFEYTV
jgi:hypothetical protein